MHPIFVSTGQYCYSTVNDDYKKYTKDEVTTLEKCQKLCFEDTECNYIGYYGTPDGYMDTYGTPTSCILDVNCDELRTSSISAMNTYQIKRKCKIYY